MRGAFWRTKLLSVSVPEYVPGKDLRRIGVDCWMKEVGLGESDMTTTSTVSKKDR